MKCNLADYLVLVGYLVLAGYIATIPMKFTAIQFPSGPRPAFAFKCSRYIIPSGQGLYKRQTLIELRAFGYDLQFSLFKPL